MAVVEAVERVADALDLPSRLRDVDGSEPEDIPEVAQAIFDDPFMMNVPPGLDPTPEEIVGVLRKSN